MFQNLFLIIFFSASSFSYKLDTLKPKNEDFEVLEAAARYMFLEPLVRIPTYNFMISSMQAQSKHDTHDLIDDFLSNTSRKTSRIENYEILKFFKIRRFFNIIFVDSFESFITMLKIFDPDVMNYQGKFLIVFMNSGKDTFMEIEMIFNEINSFCFKFLCRVQCLYFI